MRNILFILLFLGIPSALTAQENETLVKIGMEVPDFTVKMFDGQTIQIKELRGKVVLGHLVSSLPHGTCKGRKRHY